MKELLLSALFLAMLSATVYFGWGIYRVNMVAKFRSYWIDKCHEWSISHLSETNAYAWFWDEMPSFNSMCNSFTPLKIENFMPKDKIEKLLEISNETN